ncbi:MAG: tail protein [Namikivirus tsukuho]|uniref:Tail protein n=1 Tax=Bacteriophage sp. TaxID=38018 RepID=A0ABY5TRJ7_9VIRU|nr:MAG: tail protein [Bacteriophage sp.]
MSIFPLDPRDVRLALNDFPLYGVDDNGCEWHVTFQDVSGLFDGVASTLKTSEKAMTDGWYGNLPRLQGRTITIEGHIIGRCTESCVTAWNAFKSVLDTGGMRLIARLGDIDRQVRVWQSGSAPLIKWDGVNMLRFSIGLTALSPYLYGLDLVSGVSGLPNSSGGMSFPYHFEEAGVPLSSWMWSENIVSGQVALDNVGTAPSPVMIRVDGPVVNPQVLHVGSGLVMAFAMSLGSGHYATINGVTHEILVDGTDPARARITRREWSQAEPGMNVWGFNASEYSETARMTVSFYPAYL